MPARYTKTTRIISPPYHVISIIITIFNPIHLPACLTVVLAANVPPCRGAHRHPILLAASDSLCCCCFLVPKKKKTNPVCPLVFLVSFLFIYYILHSLLPTLVVPLPLSWSSFSSSVTLFIRRRSCCCLQNKNQVTLFTPLIITASIL